MTSRRFSKANALAILDDKVAAIATREKFDRSNGTNQLAAKEGMTEEDVLCAIRRAVEYGRMRAFEEFAESIAESFQFDRLPA